MKIKRLLKTFLFVELVLILATLLLTAPFVRTASSASPAVFYKGRVIQIIVPYTAGGSQDLFARIFGPYLKEYTGATIVIRNRPGGGGIAGFNETFRGKPDGLHFGCGQFSSILLNPALEVPGIKYKLETWSWIGAMFEEPMVFCVLSKGPHKDIADLKKAKDLKFGGCSPLGNYSLGSMTVANLLDLKAKVVTGFKGSSDLRLSMQKGEVDGAAFTIGATMEGIRKGIAKPLFVLQNKRFPGMPDVPAINEIMSLNEKQKQLIKIWEITPSAKSVFAPPGIPEDRLAFIRAAWRKTIANPKANAKFEGMAGYSPVTAMTHLDVERMAKAVIERKGEIKRAFKDLIKRYRMGF